MTHPRGISPGGKVKNAKPIPLPTKANASSMSRMTKVPPIAGVNVKRGMEGRISAVEVERMSISLVNEFAAIREPGEFSKAFLFSRHWDCTAALYAADE
jgi:hypothetical protein